MTVLDARMHASKGIESPSHHGPMIAILACDRSSYENLLPARGPNTEGQFQVGIKWVP